MTHRFIKKAERYLNREPRIDEIIIFDEDIPKDCNFTFVDFASTQESSFVNRNGLTPYSRILDTANEWLIKNDCWEVVACETIPAIINLTLNQYEQIKSKKISTACYELGGFTSTLNEQLVFLLRFYIKRVDRHPIDEKYERVVQQIRYLDFAPKIINDDKEFENIDQVVIRVNQSINSEEINGRIINIQTVACRAENDWSFDSECSVPISLIGKRVNILRIFYELGPPQEDEIGFADFIPECQKGGNLLKRPKFESQSSLLQRASKWLSDNPEINFCSAQSIDIKLKSMISIDTKQMSFIRDTGDYIRILRIAYTKPREPPLDIPSSSTLPPPPPIYPQCETFSLSTSYSEAKRNISEFFSRDEWTAEERFKWRLLNLETVFIFARNKRAFESNIDESFKVVSTSQNRINIYMFYAIKVYYDVGFYGVDQNTDMKKTLNSEEDNDNDNSYRKSCDLM